MDKPLCTKLLSPIWLKRSSASWGHLRVANIYWCSEASQPNVHFFVFPQISPSFPLICCWYFGKPGPPVPFLMARDAQVHLWAQDMPRGTGLHLLGCSNNLCLHFVPLRHHSWPKPTAHLAQESAFSSLLWCFSSLFFWTSPVITQSKDTLKS